MSANTQSWVLSIGLFLLPLAIAGCGVPVYEPLGGDDDDIFGGDDDDATSDDDDDATGDDDTGDDDDTAGPMTVAGIDFEYLPGATFEMGCVLDSVDCADNPNESPVHTVTLSHSFWLGSTEVTQGQWTALMGNNPSEFTSCGSDCPVNLVNWFEAAAFANAVSVSAGLAECYVLEGCVGDPGTGMICDDVTVNSTTTNAYGCEGYRLPTEAEWEYAAGAGEDSLYSGSEILDDVGWVNSNAGSEVHVVATKAPNAFGLYDMSGNVWEWIDDWYLGDYYEDSPETDPLNANDLTGQRANRGGSHFNTEDYARVTERNGAPPARLRDYYGLRVARTRL